MHNPLSAPENRLSGNFLAPGRMISKKFWLLESALMILLGMLAWVFKLLANEDSWWLHGAWCLIGMATVAPILYHAYKNGITSVFSDHKIMLVASFFLYFLFGASLLAFGSEASISEALGYYSISAIDALRANGINAIGLGIALASATWFKGSWFLGGAEKCAKYASRIPVHVVLLGFYTVGILAFLATVTRDLGLVLIVLPGSVSQFSMLLIFCVFLGTAFNGFLSSFINALSLFIMLLMVFTGLLMFNKTSLYLPLLAFFAGLSVRRQSPRYLLYGVLIVAFTITSLGNIVTYGRAFALERGATFGERVELVNEYLDGSRLSANESYSSWARLNYTTQQIAAIDFYDQGNGGKGVVLIPWLFVPRFLASNKPIITESAKEFNYKITGSYLSSNAMGIFASGYYNLGWYGLIFASIFYGWFLAQSSALCKMLIQNDALILLPLGMIGLYAAFRIDGEIIGDVMGAYVFILYPLLAMMMIFGVKINKWELKP